MPGKVSIARPDYPPEPPDTHITPGGPWRRQMWAPAPWRPESAGQGTPVLLLNAAGDAVGPGVPRLPVPRPAPRGAHLLRSRGRPALGPLAYAVARRNSSRARRPTGAAGTVRGRRAGPARSASKRRRSRGPLCIILDSLRKVLVDTHGLLPSRRSNSWRAEPPRAVVSVWPHPRQMAQAACGALTCSALFRRLSARQPRVHASSGRGL